MVHSDAMLRRRLVVSNLIDAIAGNMFSTCFAIVAVMNLHYTATQIGVMNAAGSIAILLLAIPVGSWVDRIGPVVALKRAYVAKLAMMVVATVCFVEHVLSFWAALALVFLVGLASVASENAQATSAAHVGGDGEISRTVSKMASADEAAQIAIPGAVGLALAYVGGSAVFVAACMCAAACALYFVPARPEERADEPVETEPIRHSAVAGFGIMRQDRLLWTTVLVVAAGNIGLAIGDSVDSILVLRRLDLGAPFYGLTGTVAAIAGLAASLLAPRVVDAFASVDIFTWGAFLQSAVAALPLVALSFVGWSKVILLVFSALWSMVLVITNISGFSYLASSVDKAVMGRTVAARRTVTMGCVPFAALAGGLLADWGGIEVPLIIWPAITAAAACTFYIFGPARAA